MPIFTKKPTPPSGTDVVTSVVTQWYLRSKRKNADRALFTLDGAKVSDGDVASATILLPVFAWHADGLARYAVAARGLGIKLIPDDEALLQRRVSFDRIERAASEVLLYVTEALEDAFSNLPKSEAVAGATELRGLVNNFTLAHGITVEATAEPAPVARKAA